MIYYHPLREILQSEALGIYESYGIQIFDSKGNVIKKVSDVSVNKDFVETLCRKLTRYQLSPIHLEDILEDLL